MHAQIISLNKSKIFRYINAFSIFFLGKIPDTLNKNKQNILISTVQGYIDLKHYYKIWLILIWRFDPIWKKIFVKCQTNLQNNFSFYKNYFFKSFIYLVNNESFNLKKKRKEKRHTHLSINLHHIICTRFKFHSFISWRVLRSCAGEAKVRSNKWGSSASTRRARVLNVLFDIRCWHYQSLSYIDVINQGGVRWTTTDTRNLH